MNWNPMTHFWVSCLECFDYILPKLCSDNTVATAHCIYTLRIWIQCHCFVLAMLNILFLIKYRKLYDKINNILLTKLVVSLYKYANKRLTDWPTNQPTKQLTNIMEQSPWEDNSASASERTLHVTAPKFITVLTKACHWSLSWARQIQYIPSDTISLSSWF
jgi:hypothetical protein